MFLITMPNTIECSFCFQISKTTHHPSTLLCMVTPPCALPATGHAQGRDLLSARAQHRPLQPNRASQLQRLWAREVGYVCLRVGWRTCACILYVAMWLWSFASRVPLAFLRRYYSKITISLIVLLVLAPRTLRIRVKEKWRFQSRSMAQCTPITLWLSWRKSNIVEKESSDSIHCASQFQCRTYLICMDHTFWCTCIYGI